jgi:hypothetical protein
VRLKRQPSTQAPCGVGQRGAQAWLSFGGQAAA